jgi:esterase/lipase
MEIVNYENSHTYIFKNEASNKLLVIIEGSGMYSVLGIKINETWVNFGMGAPMLQDLGDRYTIMILEKLNRQPGQNYFADMEDRANYTANNLVDCYVESVNGYLAENLFSSVIIAGFSEGACLLPLVYERIEKKDRVKALVSMAFGGFSWYESIYTLSKKQNLPKEYENMYRYFIEIYKPGETVFPDTYKEHILGMTYRWYNSFGNLKPFDYYKNINIPVLFIHGINDYNLPVESTVYVQENLTEKPFEYKYYKWEHGPRKYGDIIQLRKEMAEWIIKADRN